MKRFFFLVCSLVSVVAVAAVTPDVAKAEKQAVTENKTAAAKQKLTAAQVINKNVAVRGGLKAWRAVKTLTLSGRVEGGGKKNTDLPFVMKMERPRMSRLEIRFRDQTALQVYDGEHGWKVRPFLGRNEVEPFTPAEAKAAETWAELDGPLVDYDKKGSKVALVGMESVEGNMAYKLRLTLKNGEERHVWVDAVSFLERKIDGDPRKMDGKLRNVAIYYRDYQTVNGLTMPHVLETIDEGGQKSHKLYIEQVAINQPIEDKLFAKPQLAMSSSFNRPAE
ncbi:MAG TPA: outer membrane lipoprotein-sorting protein [Gallionellaceae bacterium]|nr:outer membrane lipoprotein-sorting protein [Gallionellaceae bacterium]